MINFIVCDDQLEIIEIVKNTITKTMFPTTLEYKIHTYNQYDKEFNKIINRDLPNKIYILDIEVGTKSGLEIAKEIRKKDWNSIILILTAHYELENLAFKSKILLFDFISKFDLYDKKICDSILSCINKVLQENKLIIKINRIIYRIDYKDILYLLYDSYKRKTIIHTLNGNYETNESLNKIKKKLKGNFTYTHRACIVNVNNTKTLDTANRVIVFKNGLKIDYLSRNHIKDVKEICS